MIIWGHVIAVDIRSLLTCEIPDLTSEILGQPKRVGHAEEPVDVEIAPSNSRAAQRFSHVLVIVAREIGAILSVTKDGRVELPARRASSVVPGETPTREKHQASDEKERHDGPES